MRRAVSARWTVRNFATTTTTTKATSAGHHHRHCWCATTTTVPVSWPSLCWLLQWAFSVARLSWLQIELYISGNYAVCKRCCWHCICWSWPPCCNVLLWKSLFTRIDSEIIQKNSAFLHVLNLHQFSTHTRWTILIVIHRELIVTKLALNDLETTRTRRIK